MLILPSWIPNHRKVVCISHLRCELHSYSVCVKSLKKQLVDRCPCTHARTHANIVPVILVFSYTAHDAKEKKKSCPPPPRFSIVASCTGWSTTGGMNTRVLLYTDFCLTLLGLCAWMCSSEAEWKLLVLPFLNCPGNHVCAINLKSLNGMDLKIFSTLTCHYQLIYSITGAGVKRVFEIALYMLSKYRCLCDF
jgi:hypothetical protein